MAADGRYNLLRHNDVHLPDSAGDACELLSLFPEILIRGFSEYPGETEFLLNHGIRFKITDAGVRRYIIGNNPDTGEPEYSVNPYLRMEIIG